MFVRRMLAICDEMEVDDENLLMLSRSKLLSVLLEKARKVADKGLPASMEERFVRQALEMPVLSVRREESSFDPSEVEQQPGAEVESQTSTPTADSQNTESSTMTAANISTAATSVTSTPAPTGPPNEIIRLLRIRTAFDFLLRSYLPEGLRIGMSSILEVASPIDFTPLNEHLARITELKKEAQALRSMSDNISRKRNAAEDDEEAAEKAEAKKRKKEEEEMKKKNVSRGVQQLKKADTSGMKKLSAFFSAKPSAKKV
jgi:hypothetical protein